MSTINGYLIGSSTISTNIGIYETTLHTGFKFIGFNDNCILDTVCIRNYIKNYDEVMNTSVSTMPTEWTPDVAFLANMNGTVDGSNVFGLIDSPTEWDLYRQEENSDIMNKVATLLPGVTNYIDYKCQGNKTYNYVLYAKSPTQLSQPLYTDDIKTTFYGIYLIDAVNVDNGANNDNVEVYKFDDIVKTDAIVQNNATTFLQNYTKYDTVVQMKRNFASSSFSALCTPYDNNGQGIYSNNSTWNDYYTEVKAFVNNRNMKYLKMRDGSIYKVVTSSVNSNNQNMQVSQLDDGIGLQPKVIQINWSECADVESDN